MYASAKGVPRLNIVKVCSIMNMYSVLREEVGPQQ